MYALALTVKVVKSSRMAWAERAARVEDIRKAWDHLSYLGMDGKIILKRFKK
jgi:hypothetical protein